MTLTEAVCFGGGRSKPARTYNFLLELPFGPRITVGPINKTFPLNENVNRISIDNI